MSARGSWVVARSVRGFGYDMYSQADRVAWLERLRRYSYDRFMRALMGDTSRYLTDGWRRLYKRLDAQTAMHGVYLSEAVQKQRAELAARHEPLEVSRG